jgi:hypothetical protein
MAKWILLNEVIVGAQPSAATVRHFPGETINDVQVPTAPIVAGGGILWPATDAVVANAAVIATSLKSRGQGQSAVLSDMLFAAVLYSLAGGNTGAVLGSAFAGTGAPVMPFAVDIPLAALKAQTSGVAFNIGAALPTNARLVSPMEIDVVAVLAGAGPLSAAVATIQNVGETAGALVASTDIFDATGIQALVGSNPYGSRGGQQLQMTATMTGGTMAALTAGHLSVRAQYVVLP